MGDTRFAAGRTVTLPQPRTPSDPPIEQVEQVEQRESRTASKLSRVLFIVVIVAVVIQVGGLGGSWLFHDRFYITTENAQVDADRLDVRAPRDGMLTDWRAGEGSQVRNDQVLGRIQATGGGPRPAQTIRAPGDGTIAVTDIVDGSYVAHGTLLASAYNLDDTYITARVDDDEVSDVRAGAPAEISIDAFPGTTFTGVVTQVQDSTASMFESAPPPGTVSRSNPQRVNQYVPVRIRLLGTGGRVLLPGMNVTAHIRKS
jgi:multidrug resistance efflux pump